MQQYNIQATNHQVIVLYGTTVVSTKNSNAAQSLRDGARLGILSPHNVLRSRVHHHCLSAHHTHIIRHRVQLGVLLLRLIKYQVKIETF